MKTMPQDLKDEILPRLSSCLQAPPRRPRRPELAVTAALAVVRVLAAVLMALAGLAALDAAHQILPGGGWEPIAIRALGVLCIVCAGRIIPLPRS